MARLKTSTWTNVLIIAGVLLFIGMVISGYLFWGFAILILLLGMAGGALLRQRQGPPEV
jgi:hypothetical protein